MLLSVSAFAAGCEQTDVSAELATAHDDTVAGANTQPVVDRSETTTATSIKPALQAPLKLDYVPEFSEQAGTPLDQIDRSDSSGERFKQRSDDSRIQLNGKLHTRFNQENVLQSVEGGEVSLELKFK